MKKLIGGKTLHTGWMIVNVESELGGKGDWVLGCLSYNCSNLKDGSMQPGTEWICRKMLIFKYTQAE